MRCAALVCLLLVGCQKAEQGSGSTAGSAAAAKPAASTAAAQAAATTPAAGSHPFTPPNSGPFYQGDARALLSAQELADGWILLFDGQTFYGWEQASKA